MSEGLLEVAVTVSVWRVVRWGVVVVVLYAALLLLRSAAMPEKTAAEVAPVVRP